MIDMIKVIINNNSNNINTISRYTPKNRAFKVVHSGEHVIVIHLMKKGKINLKLKEVKENIYLIL